MSVAFKLWVSEQTTTSAGRGQPALYNLSSRCLAQVLPALNLPMIVCEQLRGACVSRRLAPTGTDWHRLAPTGTDWHQLAPTEELHNDVYDSTYLGMRTRPHAAIRGEHNLCPHTPTASLTAAWSLLCVIVP